MSNTATPFDRAGGPSPARRTREIRLTDADRDATAGALHAAVADGRLDLQEFEERLDTVYAARVPSELAGVLDDLGVEAHRLPARREPAARGERTAPPGAVGVLAIVAVVALGILVTPHLLWLLWLAIPFAKGRFAEATDAPRHPGLPTARLGRGCGGGPQAQKQTA